MRQNVGRIIVAPAPMPVGISRLPARLQRAAASAGRTIAGCVPLALAACSTGGGWIDVATYQHHYFYEPRVAVVPASATRISRDGASIDLAFEGSTNILSVTTIPSRGDQGFILGRSGRETDYTGVLAFDAVTRNDGNIPMRLWVAASCRSQEWVMLPNRLRLVDPARNSSAIPLTVYLQPVPAMLHPDSQVFTGRWQYTPLDSSGAIRCPKGGIVAFTAGFEMTLTLASLRIVFADSLQGDGEVLRVPDVELSLTAGKAYKSTRRMSVVETVLKAIGSGAP
jgi:hypothetical protein